MVLQHEVKERKKQNSVQGKMERVSYFGRRRASLEEGEGSERCLKLRVADLSSLRQLIDTLEAHLPEGKIHSQKKREILWIMQL